MTHQQAIDSLNNYPAKIMVMGTIKTGEEYKLESVVCCTKAEYFELIKTFTEFRVFMLKEKTIE